MFTRLMLGSCREAHVLLSRRMDQPLGLAETARLGLHLGICQACRRVDRQFATLRSAARRLGH